MAYCYTNGRRLGLGMILLSLLVACGDVKKPLPEREVPERLLRSTEAESRHSAPVPRSLREDYWEAVNKGHAARYSGDFEGARLAYLHALELQPQAESATLGLIDVLGSLQQHELQAQVSERLLQDLKAEESDPHQEGARKLLEARLYLALKDASAAREAAFQALSSLSDLAATWEVIGDAAYLGEYYEEAKDAFEMALLLEPRRPWRVYLKRSNAYDELHAYQKAEQDLQNALTLAPQKQDIKRQILNSLALVLKHQGRLDEALSFAKDALKLGPEDPAVLHNLGSLAEERQDPERAQAFYEKALSIAPSPMTLYRLGHLKLQDKRWGEALQAFQEASGLLSQWTWPASTKWWPLYEVGKIYAQSENWEAAKGWFEDCQKKASKLEALEECRLWASYVTLMR